MFSISTSRSRTVRDCRAGRQVAVWAGRWASRQGANWFAGIGLTQTTNPPPSHKLLCTTPWVALHCCSQSPDIHISTLPAKRAHTNPHTLTVVPLKAMCSKKWAVPLLASVSYRLPASIHTPTVAVLEWGTVSLATRRPLGRRVTCRHQARRPGVAGQAAGRKAGRLESPAGRAAASGRSGPAPAGARAPLQPTIAHLGLRQLRQSGAHVQLRGKGLPKAQEGRLLSQCGLRGEAAQLLHLLQQLLAPAAQHHAVLCPECAARGSTPKVWLRP